MRLSISPAYAAVLCHTQPGCNSVSTTVHFTLLWISASRQLMQIHLYWGNNQQCRGKNQQYLGKREYFEESYYKSKKSPYNELYPTHFHHRTLMLFPFSRQLLQSRQEMPLSGLFSCVRAFVWKLCYGWEKT